MINIHLLRGCRYFLACAEGEVILLQDANNVMTTFFHMSGWNSGVDRDKIRCRLVISWIIICSIVFCH